MYVGNDFESRSTAHSGYESLTSQSQCVLQSIDPTRKQTRDRIRRGGQVLNITVVTTSSHAVHGKENPNTHFLGINF